MVQCYLCKGKLRVTRDKHIYDEKLKKRYHFKCFAGICRVCDMPVYTKTKHKTIGSNVWHELCYGKSHEMRRRKGAFDDGYYPEPGELEALGISRAKKDKYFRAKNPRRPTKEFWAKHYPEVLAQYKKKYPKAEAEERARKATAAIWYDTMGPKKKAKYERIRRKREGRENPPSHDTELKRSLKTDLTKLMEETRYLLVPAKGHGASKMVEFHSLRPVAVQEGLYSIKDTPEARRTLDKLGMTYTPYRMPKADIDRMMDELFRMRKNPVLVTPEMETDISGAFHRVIQGVGTAADKALVRMAREADVIMSTGPSVLLKHNPEEDDDEGQEDGREHEKVEDYIEGLRQKYEELFGKRPPGPMSIKEIEDAINAQMPKKYTLAQNPKRADYIIQDEFGKTYETGMGTPEEAEARALVFNRKYMREFKVIYPKTEPTDVKKAAEKATEELLKS